MVPDQDKRVRGAEFYIKARRTGEGSASREAVKHLASDVVATIGRQELKGRDDVAFHLSGEWPNIPVYRQGGWSAPAEDGDRLVVSVVFPEFGAGSKSGTVTFSFNDADEISEVTEQYEGHAPAEVSTQIPLHVKGLIDSALANNTPICLAYVNEAGEPVLSLRGSLQVFGPTQISAWVRAEGGGLASSLAKNPNVSLLYRDSKNRTTLVAKGKGHIETDEAIRTKVWEMQPEVEQLHTPDRTGACLIIDVTELRGSSTKGPVNVQAG